VGEGAYKGIQPGPGELRDLWERGAGETHFFRNGIPDRGLDTGNDLDRYNSFSDAYGRLMVDLSKLAFRSIGRIIPGDDRTRHIYVSGGFAKNGFFTGFISCAFPGKQAFTSGVENATSLGAALVISGSVWPETGTPLDLGLREVIC
jgi:hypothetical protein